MSEFEQNVVVKSIVKTEKSLQDIKNNIEDKIFNIQNEVNGKFDEYLKSVTENNVPMVSRASFSRAESIKLRLLASLDRFIAALREDYFTGLSIVRDLKNLQMKRLTLQNQKNAKNASQVFAKLTNITKSFKSLAGELREVVSMFLQVQISINNNAVIYSSMKGKEFKIMIQKDTNEFLQHLGLAKKDIDEKLREANDKIIAGYRNAEKVIDDKDLEEIVGLVEVFDPLTMTIHSSVMFTTVESLKTNLVLNDEDYNEELWKPRLEDAKEILKEISKWKLDDLIKFPKFLEFAEKFGKDAIPYENVNNNLIERLRLMLDKANEIKKELESDYKLDTMEKLVSLETTNENLKEKISEFWKYWFIWTRVIQFFNYYDIQPDGISQENVTNNIDGIKDHLMNRLILMHLIKENIDYVKTYVSIPRTNLENQRRTLVTIYGKIVEMKIRRLLNVKVVTSEVTEGSNRRKKIADPADEESLAVANFKKLWQKLGELLKQQYPNLVGNK